MQISADNKEAVIGCLLGAAVGDALGLCCEGMTKQRQHEVFGEIDRYHFLFGKGMTSDDTEHACMVAESLIVSAGDTEKFIKSLAWRFRFWLLGLPAGIGFATLRSILKLWLGFSGKRSGVFSAGNGPAMRSAIIGVCYGRDLNKMHDLVRASTRITHTDPRAEFGALAVALAAHIASAKGGKNVHDDFLMKIKELIAGEESDEFLELMRKTIGSAASGKPVESFAKALGLENGVSGFMYHTVPIAIHCWLSHQKDFRSAVLTAVRCGGDTDTVAAIVGGIVGAGVGKDGIPLEWLKNLWEWPRSASWMEKLGEQLSEVSGSGEQQKAISVPFYGIILRNILFFLVVLAHGFRRLLPPY